VTTLNFTHHIIPDTNLENDNLYIRQVYRLHFLNNYIDDDVAQFPPKIWSDFSASTNRTTNSCESFHSKLNGFFQSGHPNIFILDDTLLGIQSDTYVKLRSKATKNVKLH
jgi:hypothetical protein